jgi:AcrR family transcriptional regulator
MFASPDGHGSPASVPRPRSGGRHACGAARGTGLPLIRTPLVACAIDTIATLGDARASLAQIAKRAGISKGVISYHFAGKEELIQQVVAEVFAAGEAFMRPRIGAESTAAAMLRAYIESNLAFMRTHRDHIVAILEIWPPIVLVVMAFLVAELLPGSAPITRPLPPRPARPAPRRGKGHDDHRGNGTDQALRRQDCRGRHVVHGRGGGGLWHRPPERRREDHNC